MARRSSQRFAASVRVNGKLALLMGKFTAEDAIKSIQTSRFIPELVFLSTIDGGRAIARFRQKQTIYAQGDSVDSVFYIQNGR